MTKFDVTLPPSFGNSIVEDKSISSIPGDSGIVTFDFCNGGSGVLNYSTSVWEKNLESSMKIIAENVSVVIEGQYM